MSVGRRESMRRLWRCHQAAAGRRGSGIRGIVVGEVMCNSAGACVVEDVVVVVVVVERVSVEEWQQCGEGNML